MTDTTLQYMQKDAVNAHIIITLWEIKNGVRSKLPHVEDCTRKEIIIYKHKTKESIIVPADFYTDGTDSMLDYWTQEGDIDVAGSYGIQVYLEWMDGRTYTSKWGFTVEDNYADVNADNSI